MAAFPPGVAIVDVTGHGPQLEAVRGLLSEYLRSEAVKLCVRGGAQELAGLPGDYAPPAGCLMLAELGGTPTACVALRRIDDRRCEIKRLYVRAAFRGAGLAGLLLEHIMARARLRDYREIYLDTLPEMRAARQIYDLLGFRPCPAYLAEPTPGADCLVLDLSVSH